MKTKKYNSIVVFLILVVAGLTFCMCYTKPESNTSAQDLSNAPVLDDEDTEKKIELFSETVYIKDADQALNQYKFAMDNVRGYSSRITGYVNAKKFGVNVGEDVYGYKIVNNEKNEVLSSVAVCQTTTLGECKRLDVYGIGDNYTIRHGGSANQTAQQLKERVDNMQPRELTKSDYLKQYYIPPEKTLFCFDGNDILKNNRFGIIQCYSQAFGFYTKLEFNIDKNSKNLELLSDYVLSLLKAFTHDILIVFDYVKAEICIGEFGQVLSQKVDISLKFDLTPLNLPFRVGGNIMVREQFSNWHKAVAIDKTKVYPK